jgi:hypothetical protein
LPAATSAARLHLSACAVSNDDGDDDEDDDDEDDDGGDDSPQEARAATLSPLNRSDVASLGGSDRG